MVLIFMFTHKSMSKVVSDCKRLSQFGDEHPESFLCVIQTNIQFKHNLAWTCQIRKRDQIET